jgi:hypothetical protein
VRGAGAILAGAALKDVANAWATAGPAAKPAYLAAFDAARQTTDALLFGAFVAMGVYLTTLAAAILAAGIYPRWIGWASAASALLVLGGDLLVLATEAAFLAVLLRFALFMAVLVALGVTMWRHAARLAPAAAAPHGARMLLELPRRAGLGTSLPRFEQLDGVSGGVLHDDLVTAYAVDNLAPETSAGGLQPCDLRREVRDLERDPIPAPRLGPGAIGHDLSAAALAARRTQQKAQLTARQHGKGGRGVHFDVEAEPLGVETDRRIHVVDDVADADCGHRVISRPGRAVCAGGWPALVHETRGVAASPVIV